MDPLRVRCASGERPDPVGLTAGFFWRQQQADILRAEIAGAIRTRDELTRLRGDNARLREKQISASELEALRADHAALPRLRAEIEALRRRL